MSSRVLGLPALGQRCLSTSSSASYGAVGEGARTFDAKNPLAYIPKGTRPPGAAPVQAAAQAASNTWLLHPWLPIDVRIPIVLGVGLASGYVYLSTSGQLQEFEDKWKQAGLPTELPKSLPELKLPDSLPSLDSVKESLANLKLPSAASLPALPALPALPPWLSGTQQPAAPPAVTETGFSMTPEAGTLGKNDGDVLLAESAPQHQQVHDEGPMTEVHPDNAASAAAAAVAAQQEPTAEEARVLTQLFNEAFSVSAGSPAGATLPPVTDADAAGAAGVGAGVAAGVAAAAAAVTHGVGGGRAPGGGSGVMTQEAAIAEQSVGAARKSLDAMQQRMHQAADDSAAGRKRLQAAVQKYVYEKGLPGAAGAPVGAPQQTDELVLHTAGVLGITDDVSSSSLVRHAADRALVPLATWDAFQAAHRQAYSDAETFERILRQVEEYHSVTLAEESVRSRAWEAKAREYLGLAADTAHRVGAALDAQSEAHAEALQAELHNQELEMAVEYTEAANAERIGRSEALDSVRTQVNSLSLALEARSTELKASATAHAVSAAVFSLCNALHSGCSISAELSGLRRNATLSEDPLVTAVLSSLPARATDGRVGTTAELQARWPAVKRAIAVKAALPADGGGLLSMVAASLAASLKMNEAAAPGGAMSASTVDSKLAHVEALVSTGALAEAAASLQEVVRNSAAAHIADDWLDAARTRALADQAVVVLQAHAAALSCAAL